MSRATSGSDIFFDRSAIRFSSSAISPSMISGRRGFLMILTREEPVDAGADFPLPRRAPFAIADRPDLRVGPPATAAGTDLSLTRRASSSIAAGAGSPFYPPAVQTYNTSYLPL